MKRILLGLGCTLALGPGLLAQDATPAARLGTPAAALGRPVPPTVRGQEPDVTSAAGMSIIPKVMPKGGVAELPGTAVPGKLPMPNAAGPVVTIPPGGAVGSGPILMGPGSTFASPPLPTGPIFADPMMGGCALPGAPCVTDACGWYTSAEALLWYVKSYSTPPLFSVGPAFSGAALGSPGTFVPSGASTIDSNPRYGGRITLGNWFKPDWAIEASVFYVRPAADTSSVSSAQYPDQDVARPFLSANSGLESSEIVGRPGIASGYVRRYSDSHFWGLEVNLRHRWWEWCNNRVDLIAGYRHLRLSESLKIEERSLGLPGGGPGVAGVERLLFDEFTTRNRFHGLQVGAIFEHTSGPWTFGLTAKVAVGITRQTTTIRGSITPISGGGPPDLPGGLLALNSNIGTYTSTQFSVVPEVGINIGYDVTDQLRVFAGYSFLYWSDVVRPGAQIDRVLDMNRIPDFPPAAAIATVRPAPRNKSENLWAQGVNFGVLWKW